MLKTRQEGFIAVLIAAICAVFLLTGTGILLYNKIIESVNNKIIDASSIENKENIESKEKKSEPEVLAISVSEYEPKADIDGFINGVSDNYNININNAEDLKKDVKDVKKENRKNLNIVEEIKGAENKDNKADKNAKKINKTDLSAYKVNSIRTSEGDLLPENKSATVSELNAAMNAKRRSRTPDGGNGILGDIYRGAKNIIASTDEATLGASRRVLGGVADIEIEKAKLRPGGGGVKLFLDIAPKTRKSKDSGANNK